MEKQHNRGQDGAGFASIKLDVQPGKDLLVELDLQKNNQFRMFLVK